MDTFNEKNIKRDARNLSELNTDAGSVADGGSVAVKELCSTIDIENAESNGTGKLIISENDLRDIKEKLLQDAEFYANEARDGGYYSDRKTM